MRRTMLIAGITASLLLVALAAAAGSYWRYAGATLTSFVAELAVGNVNQAQALLAYQETAHPAVLSSLSLLARNVAPRLDSEVASGWLRFFFRQEIAVPLLGPEDRDLVWFGLDRRVGGWRITRLPELLAHPGSMLLRRPDGTVSLLLWGEDRVVSGAGPGEPGFQVGFGVVLGDELMSFQPGQAQPLSKLVRFVTNQLVETELEGNIPIARQTAFYDASGRPQPVGRLIPGTGGLIAYRWQGEVWAVAQAQKFDPAFVRVILGTTGFTALTHSEIRVSAPVSMVIDDRAGGGRTTVPAGIQVTLRRSGDRVVARNAAGRELVSSETRLALVPATPARVTVLSLQRGHAGATFTPSYRGYLEVAVARGTGLELLNEVSLNEYLYSVVPSEMPVGFGLEALKAQALAARAYAVSGMLSPGYAARGAHVEDSVLSQVYNNVRENPLSSQAVDETGLEIPVYEGRVVDARFFSTSSGFTANAHEVWLSNAAFEGDPIPYLQAIPQSTQVTAIRNEAAMVDFLRRRDLDAPDAGAAFFRWSVTMTRAELEASIRANLRLRYLAQAAFVLTRDGDGEFRSLPVPEGDPLGTLEEIRVVRRGAGGLLMGVEVVGTAGTYRIVKEYNIRFALRPVQYIGGRGPVALRLADGTTRADYPILPSAFAVFEHERDAAGGLIRVTITGGGNGHGSGMSQHGARGLVERGLNYREIIQHYYPGAQILNLGAGYGLPSP